jgi:hypothetical protein
LSSASSPQSFASWCAGHGIPPAAIGAFRWDDSQLATANATTLDFISGAAYGLISTELLRREGSVAAGKLTSYMNDNPATRAERSSEPPIPGSYGARALDNAGSAAIYCDAAMRIANIGEIVSRV